MTARCDTSPPAPTVTESPRAVAVAVAAAAGDEMTDSPWANRLATAILEPATRTSIPGLAEHGGTQDVTVLENLHGPGGTGLVETRCPRDLFLFISSRMAGSGLKEGRNLARVVQLL